MKAHDPILFPDSHGKRTEGHLLYIAGLCGWSLEEAWQRNWEMSEVEIDDGVEMPTAPVEPPKKRGRKPGSSNKPAQNTALLQAVEFVDIIQTDAFEYSQFAAIHGGAIKVYSNIMAAGHPVSEELSLCPQIDKLKAALKRCGRSLAITESNGQLSIKGDKLRALVPCLAEPLAPAVPDQPVLTGDFDILKAAFKAANTVADEKSDRPMFASILLDPNTVTATNGKVLIQYWHGVTGLPPAIVLPKIFAQAIVGIKYKITGIGGNYDSAAGVMKSLTFWFENGAWLKTQCYEDRWSPYEHVINVATNPAPVPEGLFDAVAAIEPFTLENGPVFFQTNAVSSHAADEEAGAIYEVKDLPAGKIFSAKLILQVAPYVKTLDLFTSQDKAYFFGGENNEIRGVFMAMAGSQ